MARKKVPHPPKQNQPEVKERHPGPLEIDIDDVIAEFLDLRETAHAIWDAADLICKAHQDETISHGTLISRAARDMVHEITNVLTGLERKKAGAASQKGGAS